MDINAIIAAKKFGKGGGSIPSEDDALNLLAEMDVVTPLTDESGVIYTDENNNILAV